MKGKISDEDLATMKKAIADEIEHIEHDVKRLNDERDGVQELAKIKEYQLKSLWETWKNGNLSGTVQRRDLALLEVYWGILTSLSETTLLKGS